VILEEKKVKTQLSEMVYETIKPVMDNPLYRFTGIPPSLITSIIGPVRLIVSQSGPPNGGALIMAPWTHIVPES